MASIPTLLETARAVVDRKIVEAPRKLEISDKTFVEKILLPSGPVVGQALDIATTAYALDHGFREGNPVVKSLAGNMAAFAAVKLAVGVGLAVAINKVENKGLKRTASVLGTLAGFVPAVSNMIQISRKK